LFKSPTKIEPRYILTATKIRLELTKIGQNTDRTKDDAGDDDNEKSYNVGG